MVVKDVPVKAVALYILFRPFVSRNLQPVSTAAIVPKVPADWLEYGAVVVGLDVFDGDGDERIEDDKEIDDGEAVKSAAVGGPRASCIATPMNPPMSPAMAAMNSPTNGRIHSRFFAACVATFTAFASVGVR
jgi:hypothetical protein